MTTGAETLPRTCPHFSIRATTSIPRCKHAHSPNCRRAAASQPRSSASARQRGVLTGTDGCCRGYSRLLWGHRVGLWMRTTTLPDTVPRVRCRLKRSTCALHATCRACRNMCAVTAQHVRCMAQRAHDDFAEDDVL
jgi:hypothetical protein